MVASHGLMVRGAHNNAHFIGSFRILRVVGIECPTPHGGPQQVTLQTQDEFEDLGIETVVAIVGAESILDPRGETGSLIIEKEATKLDSRLTIGVAARQDAYVVAMRHGHIHPPIPGRHTHLTAQFIDAIDGATTVAAGNDHLPIDGGDDELFATALQIGQLSVLHPLVDLFITAYGAYHNQRRGIRGER